MDVITGNDEWKIKKKVGNSGNEDRNGRSKTCRLLLL
jgi:hypothetical protein